MNKKSMLNASARGAVATRAAVWPAGFGRPMRAGAAALAVAATLLAGCAMTPNGRGGMTMGVDAAGLFGTEVGRFALRDGSQGILRRDNQGAYSVKLDRFMRVLPLQNAVTARIAKVETIGPRTVVVIETQERNCPFRYEVLAIEGSDILEWKIGNCNDRPRIQLSPDQQAMIFDFPAYGQISRQVYTEQRMLSSTVPVPPGVDIRAKPFADQNFQAPAAPSGDGAGNGGRFIPAPPQKDGGVRSGSDDAAAASSQRKSSRTSRSNDKPAAPRSSPRNAAAQAPATPNWTFSGEEVKATPIDLR